MIGSDLVMLWMFHEDGTMDMDTRMRRGCFIGRCLEVQEAFHFATPDNTLAAVKLYCGDLYGGMLARLDSPAAVQLMNCRLPSWPSSRGWLPGT